jgi:hypothetical protein
MLRLRKTVSLSWDSSFSFSFNFLPTEVEINRRQPVTEFEVMLTG